MPSQRRHRQKGQPPPVELTDAERFTVALKESELAKQKAAAAKEASRRAATDLKVELERQQAAAAQLAADLAGARRDHASAVERLKSARQSGRGRSEAEIAWREATARLMELETGARPAWAPVAPSPPAAAHSPEGEPDDDPATSPPGDPQS